MPVHDWTRVSAGTFHDLHCTYQAAYRSVLQRWRTVLEAE